MISDFGIRNPKAMQNAEFEQEQTRRPAARPAIARTSEASIAITGEPRNHP
jgi:hypothetical protein